VVAAAAAVEVGEDVVGKVAIASIVCSEICASAIPGALAAVLVAAVARWSVVIAAAASCPC